MRYELQTLFANGEWQNPDGETHATLYDAEIDLREMIEECEYAVSMGYMEDFNAADWRVQECEYEECEISTSVHGNRQMDDFNADEWRVAEC